MACEQDHTCVSIGYEEENVPDTLSKKPICHTAEMKP